MGWFGKGECSVRRENAQNRLLKGISIFKEWTEETQLKD